jgi:hypothetical protein
VFDVLLEPRVAAGFVVLRFTCLVPVLALVWLLVAAAGGTPPS